MNDEPSELERRLERATAPECPSDPPQDAETAALRDGWLALGQLLEAAQPSGEPFQLRSMPERTRRVGRWPVVAAAVAASLLLGVALAWKLVGGGAVDDVSRLDGAVAAHVPPGTGANVAPKPTLSEPVVDDLPWDDPLDQQIASVAEEVVRVQQEWYRLEQGFAPVYRGLEQMEDDLAESPL